MWPVGVWVWLLLLTPVMFLAYRLLHRAWGNRAVNAAFTWTSATRYWKRYLAPGMKAPDLTSSRSPDP